MDDDNRVRTRRQRNGLTAEDYQRIADMNVSDRVGQRRQRETARARRERDPDGFNDYDYGDYGNADNDANADVQRLTAEVDTLRDKHKTSVIHQRPFYDVPVKKSDELRALLLRPDLTPMERANAEGMLQVNRRYGWYTARRNGRRGA